MLDKKTITASTNEDRLDKFIADNIESISRTYAKQLIKDSQVTVNGRLVKPRCKVKEGDRVTVDIPAPQKMEIIPENVPIDIVYEDSDIVVINKQRGLVVHPAVGHYTGTLVNGLLFHCPDLEAINDTIRPGIVHRLDKDTTGLLVVAKNQKAMASLSSQIRERLVKRTYLALVCGNIPETKGRIEAPIGRHQRDRKKMAVVENGKVAITHFTVLERFVNYTLLEVQLETGRTHQIRVHLDYIRHAVVDDPVYGSRHKHFNLKGQALHAYRLEFTHPKRGESMIFSVEPPADFSYVINQLKDEIQGIN